MAAASLALPPPSASGWCRRHHPDRPELRPLQGHGGGPARVGGPGALHTRVCMPFPCTATAVCMQARPACLLLRRRPGALPATALTLHPHLPAPTPVQAKRMIEDIIAGGDPFGHGARSWGVPVRPHHSRVAAPSPRAIRRCNTSAPHRPQAPALAAPASARPLAARPATAPPALARPLAHPTVAFPRTEASLPMAVRRVRCCCALLLLGPAAA